MKITDIAREVVEYYQGNASQESVNLIAQVGWIELINGWWQVAK